MYEKVQGWLGVILAFLLLLALLLVGCGAPPKEEICEEDYNLGILLDEGVGAVCPPTMRLELYPNGTCYYTDTCGKQNLIGGCVIADTNYLCPKPERYATGINVEEGE